MANDYGYAEVFARQVRALGQPGDVLVLFGASGESENLVRAAATGRQRGVTTIAITGDRPNRLATLADLAVQELQQIVTHLLCDVVEAELAATAPPLSPPAAGWNSVVARVAALAEGAGVLAAATTLPEHAALIERAAVVTCGNTLPLHLADAVGTPVVALFAGTDLEEQWCPRTTPARLLRRPTPRYPCYRFDCPIGRPCLAVEPAEVVAAVATLARATSGA